MGYNNDSLRDPIVVDIETVPLDGAADYLPPPEVPTPPDLEAIKAAGNLKDPDKIAADIAKRKIDAEAAYQAALAKSAANHAAALDRAALDFNLARIVAIGWSDGGEPNVIDCRNECAEASALEAFWPAVAHAPLVGFRIRTFDAPMLMARSRFLGVKHPALDLGQYNRTGRLIDLWDVLTFGLRDYDTTNVMPRKLKTYAKRYGLTVNDETDGKDISQLVAAGDWEAVKAHCASDVRLTTELAYKLGVLKAAPEPATVF